MDRIPMTQVEELRAAVYWQVAYPQVTACAGNKLHGDLKFPYWGGCF